MEKKGKIWELFRQIRIEIIFSGESLRINARALLFGLAVGLVVACTMYALFTLFRKGDL